MTVPAVARPGQPGNRGRPKGALNKRTKFWAGIDDKLEAAAPGIIDKLLEKALGGCPKSMQLYLERVRPAPRSRKLPGFRMPDITTSEGLSQAYQAVAEGLAQGIIDPDELTKIVTLLDAQRRNLEDTDTQKRLKAVEARLHEGVHE